MNWSIGKKIGLAFILAMAFLLAVNAVSYRTVGGLGSMADQRKHTQDVLVALDDVLVAFLDVQTLASDGVISHGERETYDAADSVLSERMKDLRWLTRDDPEQRSRLDQLESLIRRQSGLLRAGADSGAGDDEQPGKIEEGKKLKADIRTAISDIKRQEHLVLEMRSEQARTSARASRLAISAASLVAFLIVALNGVMVIRSISKRINTVVEGAEKIGGGLLDHRIGVSSQDEIGRLGSAFNRMAENLQRREQALAESERKHRALVNNIPDITWTVDVTGKTLFVSPKIEEVYGYTSDEIYTESPEIWLNRIHPNDAEAVRKAYKQLFTMDAPFDIEYRIQRSDGRWIWLLNRAASTYERDGVKCADGVFSDITERKRHQEQLDRFFTVSLDMLCIAGCDGYFKRLNPAFERVLGFSGEELLAEPFLHFVHPDDRDATIAEVESLSTGINTFSFENRYRCKDGSYKWMLWNATPVPADGLIYAAARDITERKHAEKEVQRARDAADAANVAKSQFLANMSHELRTPLNAIIGFSDLLAEGTFGPLNDKQNRYANNILTSGRHLLQLINDILDLSKVEAGRMEPELRPFEISATLRDVHTIVKGLAHKKEISVTIGDGTAGQPLPPITADQRMFKQIMYNLLSNAIKFTPEGGSVRVGAKLISDPAATLGLTERLSLMEFSVTDTGIGIKPEDCDRIFQEFVQVDHSYGRKQEGTGLGLALTRKLVQLHGGSIWVKSDVGRGSTFTFTLPIATVKSQPLISNAPDEDALVILKPTRPADRSRPLVLVVEDDRSAADLLRHYLTEGGYDVVQAFSAEQAFDMAYKLRPDVMTLDVILPNKDGWQLLTEMRASELNDIPVVVVSITDDRALGHSLGAAEWLVKPVDKEGLLDALHRLVTRAGRVAETVLVIDDEPAEVEYLADTLGQQGLRVLKAYGGQEGIDLAMQHRPDVIVLDLMMPDVNGFEVVHRLRQHRHTVAIPIVIFTAKDLNKQDLWRIDGQVQAVTFKSAKENLLTELERVLGRSALSEVRKI